MKYLTSIVNDAKLKINNERIKIDKLHKVIDGYELAIEILSQTERRNAIQKYKQRIEKCDKKIQQSLDIIKNNKEMIFAVKRMDKIIQRGEKCA